MALLLDSLTGYSELKKNRGCKNYEENEVTNIVQRIVHKERGNPSTGSIDRRYLFRLLDFPFNILTSLFESRKLDGRIAILSLLCSLHLKVRTILVCKSAIINTLCCFIIMEFDLEMEVDSVLVKTISAAVVHLLILLFVVLQGYALRDSEIIDCYGLAIILSYATTNGKVLLMILRIYNLVEVALLYISWPTSKTPLMSFHSTDNYLRLIYNKPFIIISVTGTLLSSMLQPFVLVMTWSSLFLLVTVCVLVFSALYLLSKLALSVKVKQADVVQYSQPLSYLLVLKEICLLRKYMRAILKDLQFADHNSTIIYRYNLQASRLELCTRNTAVFAERRIRLFSRLRYHIRIVYSFLYFVICVFNLVVLPYLFCFYMCFVVPLVSNLVLIFVLTLMTGLYFVIVY